VYTRDPFKNSF